MKNNFAAYFQLAKPRLLALALATTLVGFFLAAAGSVNYGVLLSALAGAALIGAGANSLNQFLERDIDAKMRRTENRPLPSQKLGATAVLVFGLAAAVAGLIQLVITVNALTAFLAAATLASYVALYTPLKRVTHLNTFVGAIPGALPSVMGWTAAGGRLGVEAAILFCMVYLWQIPHFYAIAWVYREDYARAGLRMVTDLDVNGRGIAWRLFFYCLMLVPVTLLPTFSRMAGWAYFVVSGLAGIGFIFFALRLVLDAMAQAKRFVSLSIIYLTILIVALMADKA